MSSTNSGTTATFVKSPRSSLMIALLAGAGTAIVTGGVLYLYLKHRQFEQQQMKDENDASDTDKACEIILKFV